MAPQEQSNRKVEASQQKTPEKSAEVIAFEAFMRFKANVLNGGPGLLPFVLMMRPLRQSMIAKFEISPETFDTVFDTLFHDGEVSTLRYELNYSMLESSQNPDGFYLGGIFRTFESVAQMYHLTVEEVHELVQAELSRRIAK